RYFSIDGAPMKSRLEAACGGCVRVVRLMVLLLAATVPASPAAADGRRSHAVARAFEAAHRCPSTGLAYGPCSGYVRDHVWPLCAGGADAVENLAWEPEKEARAKDI